MFLSDEMQLLQAFGYQECDNPKMLHSKRQHFNRLCFVYLAFCGITTGLVALLPLCLLVVLGGSWIDHLSDSTSLILSLIWTSVFGLIFFKCTQALLTIRVMGNAAFDLDLEKINLCEK